MKRSLRFPMYLLATALLLPALPAVAASPVADVSLGTVQVEWQPAGDFAGMKLRVSGPLGVTEREFGAGENPLFDLGALESAADGLYTWEIVAAPKLDESSRRAMAAGRTAGGDIDAGLRSALPDASALVQSGSFRVVDGAILQPTDGPEPAPQGVRRVTSDARGGEVKRAAAEDVVYNDDVIITGSLCVGFDCVNNESFGFDTIRLKENNTRIKFEDTSSSTGFPTTDWQLTANDSASGGSNKFSIEDITGARVPFTITGGASTNSIFVDSTGRVGFRTSTPVLDLHVSTGNTPAIRLEQTNASGFTAQTWDIAGNEANFFVRDVTSGSRLPFRIRPGAPTSSIDIANDGDVGIGTASPDAKLEVESGVATAASVRYTNTNASGFAGGEYFEGATQGLFVGLDNANNLARINAVNSYPLVILTNSTERIRFPAPGGDFITAANGASLTAGGIWADASSRSYKQEIESLETSEAMAAFRELVPVSFRYAESPEERYVGFIAEDVPELVAMSGRKNLAAMEIVALLTKVVQEQEQRLQALATQNEELREAVDQLLDRAPE